MWSTSHLTYDSTDCHGIDDFKSTEIKDKPSNLVRTIHKVSVFHNIMWVTKAWVPYPNNVYSNSKGLVHTTGIFQVVFRFTLILITYSMLTTETPFPAPHQTVSLLAIAKVDTEFESMYRLQISSSRHGMSSHCGHIMSNSQGDYFREQQPKWVSGAYIDGIL